MPLPHITDNDHLQDILFSQAPGLREFSLISHSMALVLERCDFSKLENLHLLKIKGCKIYDLVSVPPWVRHLSLPKNLLCYLSPGSGKPGLSPNAAYDDALGLESLDLSLTTLPEYSTLVNLLERNNAKLTMLDLSSSAPLFRDDIANLITSHWLDHVVDLRLPFLQVDDQLVEMLAKSCLELKRLNISDTRVTGIAVGVLATLPQGPIEELDISHCSRVSYDAVEYARSKGVKVTFRFPDHHRSRRRQPR